MTLIRIGKKQKEVSKKFTQKPLTTCYVHNLTLFTFLLSENKHKNESYPSMLCVELECAQSFCTYTTVKSEGKRATTFSSSQDKLSMRERTRGGGKLRRKRNGLVSVTARSSWPFFTCHLPSVTLVSLFNCPRVGGWPLNEDHMAV